jgi:tubulin-specific chaperone D
MRFPLMEGYVTAVGFGSESIIQASRQALALNFGKLPVFPSEVSPGEISLFDSCQVIVEVLRQNLLSDRIAVPALQTLAFLFDVRIMQRLLVSDFK